MLFTARNGVEKYNEEVPRKANVSKSNLKFITKMIEKQNGLLGAIARVSN